ncbi:hypothetical protein OH76DRAFT_187542 [Lentinus brumalis]|uniref:Uncharacterized protein n=1 Tax=Lentinus brumalis TaxID=2498619 RepID=A0A371CN26_9APHY|nr:hypothetical protein OH76DRAFT_187542 [Polyporus brumalis]
MSCSVIYSFVLFNHRMSFSSTLPPSLAPILESRTSNSELRKPSGPFRFRTVPEPPLILSKCLSVPRRLFCLHLPPRLRLRLRSRPPSPPLISIACASPWPALASESRIRMRVRVQYAPPTPTKPPNPPTPPCSYQPSHTHTHTHASSDSGLWTVISCTYPYPPRSRCPGLCIARSELSNR